MTAVKACDGDGFKVKAGDFISFSFGIPGQRVEAELFEKDDALHFRVIWPDRVQPRGGSLRMLRYHVGEFWKINGPVMGPDKP